MLIDEEDNNLSNVVSKYMSANEVIDTSKKHSSRCDCCNRWLFRESIFDERFSMAGSSSMNVHAEVQPILSSGLLPVNKNNTGQ